MEFERAFPSPESIAVFQKKILSWYRISGRNFPWRNNHLGCYRKIVTEVLLQRTRAELVAVLHPEFFRVYPNWRALAQAEYSSLCQILRPFGLWRKRADVLKQLAIEMVARAGRFPRSRSDLELLPGVGPYIASSVILLCHDEVAYLLDVNMARVLERVLVLASW